MPKGKGVGTPHDGLPQQCPTKSSRCRVSTATASLEGIWSGITGSALHKALFGFCPSQRAAGSRHFPAGRLRRRWTAEGRKPVERNADRCQAPASAPETTRHSQGGGKGNSWPAGWQQVHGRHVRASQDLSTCSWPGRKLGKLLPTYSLNYPQGAFYCSACAILPRRISDGRQPKARPKAVAKLAADP